MTIALLDQDGVHDNLTGSTLLTGPIAGTFPVGTLVVIGWSANGSSVSTVADNSTQAGAANSYTIRTQIVNGTSRITVIWCVLTRSILTTDTITVTSATTTTRRALRLLAFSGVDPAPLDQADNGNAVASPLTIGPTAGLARNGTELAVSMTGWFGGAVLSGAADTQGYTLATENSLGITSRVEAISAYKLGVGPSAETDAMTFTSITSAVGEILTFVDPAPPDDFVLQPAGARARRPYEGSPSRVVGAFENPAVVPPRNVLGWIIRSGGN